MIDYMMVANECADDENINENQMDQVYLSYPLN